MAGRERVTQVESAKALLDAIPAARALTIQVRTAGARRATLVMNPGPEVLQVNAIVHGGVLTTLADTAAVASLLPSLKPGQTAASIELNMQFLKPAVAGLELRAEGTVLRMGKRVAFCECHVHQGGAAVAKGSFSYLIFPKETA